MVPSDGPGLWPGSTASVVSGSASKASDGPGLWLGSMASVVGGLASGASDGVQGHEQCDC